SREGRHTEVPAADYDVVVFENRFPAFSARSRPESAAPPTPYTPLAPGAGRCEVVCFTDQHDGTFADLPPTRVRTVLGRSPTAPPTSPRTRPPPRCSVSRTGAWRSGSPCTTHTGRSTRTRSCHRGPASSWRRRAG